MDEWHDGWWENFSYQKYFLRSEFSPEGRSSLCEESKEKLNSVTTKQYIRRLGKHMGRFDKFLTPNHILSIITYLLIEIKIIKEIITLYMWGLD